VHRAPSPFRQHEAPQCAVVESQCGRPDLRSVQRDELLEQRLDRVRVLFRLVDGPRGAPLGGRIDSFLQREPRVGSGLARLGQAKRCATAERELGGPAVVTIPDRAAHGARRLHDEVESVGAAVGNLVADDLATAIELRLGPLECQRGQLLGQLFFCPFLLPRGSGGNRTAKKRPVCPCRPLSTIHGDRRQERQ
jgi:hypothetical protein